MTHPKHGFYSHHFTPEEIEKLSTIPTDQFLADINRRMLGMAADLLKCPGNTPGGSSLSDRERQRILKLIIAITRRTKP